MRSPAWPSLLCAVLLGALSLAAQAPPGGSPPAPESFSESIDVRVVNVEAVVTDRRGRRIPSLKAADFRLTVDGREVPIDYFAEVDASATGAGGGPDAQRTAPDLQAPPKGRDLVLFIDESFSVKAHRDMVLKKLGEQLAQLGPEDRMAIVAFDGDRLAVLTDWTTDHAALAAALARAKGRPSAGNAIVAWRRVLQDDVNFQAEVEAALGLADSGPGPAAPPTPPTPQSTGGAGLSGDPLGAGEPLDHHTPYEKQNGVLIGGIVTEAISARLAKIPIAVTAAMRAFADAPGRKLLFLLSGGWPSLSAIVPIAGEANRLGFTVYPVDVPGVDTTFVAGDVTNAGPSMLGTFKDGWESNAEYSLEMLARATGGKASIDSTRLAALPRLLDDTRSYYWMSFTPRWAGDDRSHRIQVEVERPGLRVRARRSFADFSTATRTKLNAEGVLFFGGDAAAKQLRVEVGEREKPTLRGRRVAFEIAIPVPPFAAGKEGQAATDLVLSAQSLDDFGTRSLFPETPVRLALDPPTAPGGTARYKVALRLKRRHQKLIFTLREPATGTVLWGETQLDP